MQKSDLSPSRRKLLVSLAPDYPGAFALVPPPTPHTLILNSLQEELPRAREALDLVKDVSARLPNPRLITRTIDRREAVRSSQIEGTSSEVSDLLAYEATGSDEGLPPDVQVTHNYVSALEYGLQQVETHGKAALTTKLIKDLHAHLMANTDFHGEPGEFRKKQNWIGGSNIYRAKFIPPPHEAVDSCIDDLMTLVGYAAREEDQKELSIVMRMAIAHAQFETIHPFIDGNGRVGRLLLPLMLASEGYPPVYLAGYLKENQHEYYDTLAGVQLKDKWTEWVQFFALGVEAAAQESIKTALALEALLEKWRGRVAELGLRSQSVVYRFPELMIGNPVLTAHRAKDLLGISFPSASATLDQLEGMGILKQPKKKQRNRTFIAHEVIEILNRPPQR